MNEYQALDIAINYLNEGILCESAILNKSNIKIIKSEETFDENFKILKKNWNQVTVFVSEFLFNWIQRSSKEFEKYSKNHPDSNSHFKRYFDLASKYDSAKKVEKSLKFITGEYANNKQFILNFDHEIANIDGHSIILNCQIKDENIKMQKPTLD